MNTYESTSPNFITTAFDLLRIYTASSINEHITYVNIISHSRYMKDVLMIAKGTKYKIRMEQGYYNPYSFTYQISKDR